MMNSEFDRRDFLKVLGWGGTAVALTGCGNGMVESGKETVVSYVETNDYMVPSVSVYFNSTCAQCDAGCSITGRIREGRVLKLEGNPESPINRGKTSGLGQAGVQNHYNPDRIRAPLLRTGNTGEEITWDKAYALIDEKLKGVNGNEVAFLTGGMSGHHKVLLNNYLDSIGCKNHFVYEAIGPAVVRAANKKSYGVEMPRFNISKARVVLSFGADFLGAWVSPVNFSQQYAQFRKGTDGHKRGVLIQVESKMTITGANADRWLVVRPGTEGILALGIINALGAQGVSIPGDIAAAVKAYDKDRVSKDTGVSAEQIDKIAAILKERTPSLVLAGSAAEGYAHGSQNAAAINLLNHVLGNVGKTVEAPVVVPFPQMVPTTGNTAALNTLNDGLSAGKFKVLFSYAANPVFTAPSAMKFKDNMTKAGFKVIFAQYLDETALQADLVLPLDSALEDWGTQVPEYMAEVAQINIRQPLMEKLHPETRSMGEILLALIKQRRPDDYKKFDDFYGYMRTAILQNKVALGGEAKADDDVFWNETLSKAIIKLPGAAHAALSAKPVSTAGLSLPEPAAIDAQYPFQLIPHVNASLRDGRNTNQPWLQESPDPLTTIVWDSWMEIHPKKAAELGIQEGDIVEVAGKNGSVKVQAYLFPGIHPDAVSIPLGRGHEAMGRYAKGYGVNPFQILDMVFDKETGELALHETRVKISKTGERVIVVKDEGPVGGNQEGQKIVPRMSTDKVNLSKEI